MNNLLRLLVIAVLAAGAIVLISLGFVRHDADLMAPVTVMLLVLAVLVYLLPTGLAVYRDCRAAVWIAVVNVLLGWTLFGWFVALGWAASGKIREPVHPTGAPPVQPSPGH
jgi:membrane protein YdbS with pleckstrin-like domain